MARLRDTRARQANACSRDYIRLVLQDEVSGADLLGEAETLHRSAPMLLQPASEPTLTSRA